MITAETVVTKHHRTEGAIVDGVADAMKDASERGYFVSQQHVPIDTGELQLSGQPPTSDDDGNWRWGYDAPHALPVEYGSKPHWAPLEPLLGWARRVLGDESAGYAVRQKIAAEGTQPQPYIRPGVNAQRAHLRGTGVRTYIRDKIPGL